MNRDEILAKSRSEHKNQDMYEQEVIRIGWTYGSFAAVILALLFFGVQIAAGGGANWGLFAVAFVIPAVGFIVKYRRIKRKHELLTALVYITATVLFSAAHIYSLIVL